MSEPISNQSESVTRSMTERQMQMKSIFIRHDRFNEAWNFIRRAHYPVEGGTNDFGCISALIGESRAGKTSVAKRYMESYPPNVVEGGLTYPVIYVNIPIDGQRALLEFVADALAVKHTRRTNNPTLQCDIQRALVEQRVELLIFDEMNTVVAPENRRGISYTLNFLRKLLDHAHLNIVCIGLEETYDLLVADPQMTGRGGLPYLLVRPYSWDSDEERKLFRLLCHQFDKQLPFDEQAGLGSAWFAERLFYSSKGGIIGRLRDFVYSAGCLALNDGSETIRVKHFAQAYEFIKSRGVDFNPWVHDMSKAPALESTVSKLPGKSPRDVFSKKAGPHESP